jgi:hypothetical protein
MRDQRKAHSEQKHGYDTRTLTPPGVGGSSIVCMHAADLGVRGIRSSEVFHSTVDRLVVALCAK